MSQALSDIRDREALGKLLATLLSTSTTAEVKRDAADLIASTICGESAGFLLDARDVVRTLVRCTQRGRSEVREAAARAVEQLLCHNDLRDEVIDVAGGSSTVLHTVLVRLATADARVERRYTAPALESLLRGLDLSVDDLRRVGDAAVRPLVTLLAGQPPATLQAAVRCLLLLRPSHSVETWKYLEDHTANLVATLDCESSDKVEATLQLLQSMLQLRPSVAQRLAEPPLRAAASLVALVNADVQPAAQRDALLLLRAVAGLQDGRNALAASGGIRSLSAYVARVLQPLPTAPELQQPSACTQPVMAVSSAQDRSAGPQGIEHSMPGVVECALLVVDVLACFLGPDEDRSISEELMELHVLRPLMALLCYDAPQLRVAVLNLVQQLLDAHTVATEQLAHDLAVCIPYVALCVRDSAPGVAAGACAVLRRLAASPHAITLLQREECLCDITARLSVLETPAQLDALVMLETLAADERMHQQLASAGAMTMLVNVAVDGQLGRESLVAALNAMAMLQACTGALQQVLTHKRVRPLASLLLQTLGSSSDTQERVFAARLLCSLATSSAQLLTEAQGSSLVLSSALRDGCTKVAAQVLRIGCALVQNGACSAAVVDAAPQWLEATGDVETLTVALDFFSQVLGTGLAKFRHRVAARAAAIVHAARHSNARVRSCAASALCSLAREPHTARDATTVAGVLSHDKQVVEGLVACVVDAGTGPAVQAAALQLLAVVQRACTDAATAAMLTVQLSSPPLLQVLCGWIHTRATAHVPQNLCGASSSSTDVQARFHTVDFDRHDNSRSSRALAADAQSAHGGRPTGVSATKTAAPAALGASRTGMSCSHLQLVQSQSNSTLEGGKLACNCVVETASTSVSAWLSAAAPPSALASPSPSAPHSASSCMQASVSASALPSAGPLDSVPASVWLSSSSVLLISNELLSVCVEVLSTVTQDTPNALREAVEQAGQCAVVRDLLTLMKVCASSASTSVLPLACCTLLAPLLDCKESKAAAFQAGAVGVLLPLMGCGTTRAGARLVLVKLGLGYLV